MFFKLKVNGMDDEGHKQSHRARPPAHLWERVAALFTLREAVSRDRALTARLIKGALLASLPILLVTIAVHWALGTGPTEAENPALIALSVVGCPGGTR